MSAILTRPPEWDIFEAYFLAGWPCEQGLRTVLPFIDSGDEEPTIVDIGAGGGVFGQRARLIRPDAEIIGVEVRTDERQAARHYDHWIEDDVFAVERRLRDIRPHLVMGNPAFSRTLAKVRLSLGIVHPGGFVLFLVRADWGQNADAWDFLHTTPPLVELEIGGRPQFLTGKKADGEDYGTDWAGAKWLLWRKPTRATEIGIPGEWRTRQLPRLPSASLSWNVRPGTEPTPSPLPSAFWPESAIGGRS